MTCWRGGLLGRTDPGAGGRRVGAVAGQQGEAQGGGEHLAGGRSQHAFPRIGGPKIVPGYVSGQLLSMGWIIDVESGARIIEVGRRWLRSDDAFRAAVAMGLENETYLADSWDELLELAEPMKQRFPSMADDVSAWLERARLSYERRETGFWTSATPRSPGGNDDGHSLPSG
ncbi:hypothetical protein [Streptomyces shaanxiensis]